MKLKLLDYLVCPNCGDELMLEDVVYEQDEVKQGVLVSKTCNSSFPIVRFIPRFVPEENYAAGFGLQWNRFRRTQIDKYNGTTLSKDRFYRESGWNSSDLQGSLVLEAGCGAGRFTQICLDARAEVIAFDLSNSVEACLDNFGLNRNLHLIQADIYRLPFRQNLFPWIFCFGVLQHTPRPKDAFLRLASYLAPGGSIAIDIYRKGIWDWVFPKRYLRVITTRIPHTTLFNLVSRGVPMLLPLSDLISRVPRIGLYLRRFVPVANIRGYAQLPEELIREWAILDTYDMLAAKYDQPQTVNKIRQWFEEAGLRDIHVFGRKTLVIGRGKRG